MNNMEANDSLADPVDARDIYLSVLREVKASWTDLNKAQQEQIEQVEVDKEICSDSGERPDCLRKAFHCYLSSWLSPQEDNEGVYCPVTFDGHKCWGIQIPGRVKVSCAEIITSDFHDHCQIVLPSEDTSSLMAYRDCGPSGQWLQGTGDYTACKHYFERCLNVSSPSDSLLETINGSKRGELLDEQTKNIVVYVFTGLAVTSVILLSVSFFIFSYYKTLYCNRNSIHKNLCAALLLHVISLLVILSPRITGDHSIYREAWSCKSFMFLSFYAVPASIMWTFVEGLYLSQRLTLAVFKKEAPFKLYYLIGWGFPLVLAIAWALATEFSPPDVQYSSAGDIIKVPPNVCWSEYSKQPYHWIITGPCLVALGVNLIFLIMIIIVLVTKLRANNAVETVQVRKAIKATFILVPLLGISNLLFVANPNDNGFGEKAYIVVNLILKGSQGIFVALIYCFLNAEVQMAISKSCYRAALRRNPETQSFRFGSIYNTDAVPAMDRRKSSTRTTSTTLVSSTEMQRIRTLASKRASLPATSHHVHFTSFPKYYHYPLLSAKGPLDDSYL